MAFPHTGLVSILQHCMAKLWPATSRLLIIATVLFLVSGSFYFYLTRQIRYPYRTFSFSDVSESTCGDDSPEPSRYMRPIPNIVHYVWLLKDTAELHLTFKLFVSMYSAHLFWRPKLIYLHTDATPEALAHAREAGDPWTRRILAMSGLTPHYVQAPNVTQKGVAVVQMEHKADFLRIEALRQFGGIYLDVDAVPLRDVADLRASGFANVLGGATALSMKHSGYVNNGVMMAVPNSNLMNLYYHAAHTFFDGAWATASVQVLTDLANRLVAIPGEALILQPSAFAPVSWEYEDQKRLFLPTLSRNASAAGWSARSPLLSAQANEIRTAPESCADTLAWLKMREAQMAGAGADSGELSFDSAYVLHAFDDAVPKMRGWDRVVDAEYVCRRQSNYARAVYPAMRHAFERGIIRQSEWCQN